MSLYEIAKDWGVSYKDILDFIGMDNELITLYKTIHKYTRIKFKENNVKLFDKPLSKIGCKLLASAIIKRALNDCDLVFFESYNLDFYQQFTNSCLNKEDYLKLMQKPQLDAL